MVCVEWAAFQSALNSAANGIMQAAYLDRAVMPVNRFRQAHRCLLVYRQLRPEATDVQRYTELLGRRRPLWAACSAGVRRQCELQFVQCNSNILTAPLCRNSCHALYQYLQAVHCGFVQLSGACVSSSQVVVCDWPRAGVVLWLFRADE